MGVKDGRMQASLAIVREALVIGSIRTTFFRGACLDLAGEARASRSILRRVAVSVAAATASLDRNDIVIVHDAAG